MHEDTLGLACSDFEQVAFRLSVLLADPSASHAEIEVTRALLSTIQARQMFLWRQIKPLEKLI
jgi:hypothetical protein